MLKHDFVQKKKKKKKLFFLESLLQEVFCDFAMP